MTACALVVALPAAGKEGVHATLTTRLPLGAPAGTVFAHGQTSRYAATVRVPKGGIRDLEIGIRGWSSGPNGTRPADLLLPITNDPVRR